MKNTLIYIFFVFLLIPSANASENPLQARLELMERMRYGYIDKEGTFIIEAQYEFADHFINGVARVRQKKGDDWAFIDKNNNIIVHPVPTIKDAKIVNRFPSGNAWIASKKIGSDTRLAIIDNNGKPLSEFKFWKININPNDSKYLIAELPNRKGCLYITDEGQMLSDQTYNRCGPFNQNLAKVVKGNKVGFLNDDGQLAIPFKFGGKYDLSFTVSDQGLIPVQENKLHGYINNTGEWVIPPQYSYAGSFSEGYARIAYKNDQGKEVKGFIDHTGEILFTHSYKSTGMAFHNGLISFKKGGKWGFMDPHGNVKIPPIFPGGGTGTYFGPDFSEGFAAVGPAKEYQRGYISTSGEYSIPPILNDAAPFRNGVARVLALPKELREAIYVDVIENWEKQQEKN